MTSGPRTDNVYIPSLAFAAKGRTDDIPDPAVDPHTLDEYAAALAFAAERTPCKAEDVRRMVWGSKGGRDATELALDELERAGRTDKVFGGRWKPRAKPLTEITLDGESFTWDGPGDSPAIVLKGAVKVVNGPGPHPPGCLTITELADVLDGSTIGDAPEGSPWIDVETPDIPGLSAGTFELPGVPLPRGDRETAPEAPDPAGKTPDGVIADDPDAEVEPTEGDGGLTLGDVVRAADAAGFTVDFSFPKKPRADEATQVAIPFPCPPGFRWEARSTEKGFRLVRPADGWVAATIGPSWGAWGFEINCGELRGREGSPMGQDAAAEKATNRLLARRADWPPVAAEEAPPSPPRTLESITAKYATGPFAVIARAQELLMNFPERRAAVAKAVEELRTALAGGEALLKDMDRMIGGAK